MVGRDYVEKMYHINIHGAPAECEAASPETCTAKGPKGVGQFHSDDPDKIEGFMYAAHKNVLDGKKRRKFPKEFVVTDELVGPADTDVERLSGDSYDGRHALWLRDTEGRPMAYLKIMENDETLQLCDLEVRPEFRGRGLVKRIVRAAELKHGKKMTHNGGYTPEGLVSIAPLFHSAEELSKIRDVHLYPSMTFVESWDSAYPRHPL